jgi:hypothetical protein
MQKSTQIASFLKPVKLSRSTLGSVIAPVEDEITYVHDFDSPKSESKDQFAIGGLLAEGLKTTKGSFSRGVPVEAKFSLPPLLNCSPVFRQTLRFIQTSASPALTSISANELAAACGSVATGATVLQPLYSSLKIHSVTIWPGQAAASLSNECIVSWLSELSGVGIAKDDVREGSLPGGITVTAARHFVPPKGSQGAFWIGTQFSTANIFIIQCNQGAIVDVCVSATLTNGLTSFSTQTTAAASAGSLYWPFLDGHSGVYKPLGRPTLA